MLNNTMTVNGNGCDNAAADLFQMSEIEDILGNIEYIESSRQEVIKWSPTFSCGIKLVDEQHKGLIDLINDMFNHVSGDDNAEREYFSKIIHDVKKYIETHFQTEEKLMILTNFSGYAEHKKVHDAFTINLVRNSLNYVKRLTFFGFAKYLKEWVLTHVACMDKEYVKYFKQIATHKADGSLSITREDLLNAKRQQP